MRGAVDAALAHFERALVVAEAEAAVSPLALSDLAMTLNNIGCVLAQDPGRADEARDVFQRCLGAKTRALGFDHDSVANTLLNIARTGPLSVSVFPGRVCGCLSAAEFLGGSPGVGRGNGADILRAMVGKPSCKLPIPLFARGESGRL